MNLPTVCRDEFNKVYDNHIPDDNSDTVVSYQMEYYNRVAEFLGPVIGADFSGSGGLMDWTATSAGVWFRGTYDELEIKIYLLFV